MKVLIIIFLAMTATQVSAHGGRTNSSGCHNDNKNGGYHCHGGSSSRSSSNSSSSSRSSSTSRSTSTARPAYRAPVSSQQQKLIGDTQTYLKTLGYYDGAVNGVLTQATTRSIRAYQETNGFVKTGEASHRLLTYLKEDAEPE